MKRVELSMTLGAYAALVSTLRQHETTVAAELHDAITPATNTDQDFGNHSYDFMQPPEALEPSDLESIVVAVLDIDSVEIDMSDLEIDDIDEEEAPGLGTTSE